MAVESSGRGHPRPRAPRWAAGIAMVQGVLLVLGAVAYSAWLVAARPDNIGFPAGAAVMVFLFGAVLLAVGRLLGRGARVSVSPIIVIELMMLPIAWSMGQARQWAIAAALAVPALAVLGLLFSPEGREVIRGDG